MPSNNTEQQGTVDGSESTATDSQYATYVPFHSFNLNQWIEWLNAFLSNVPREPLIPINKEEPHHSLIDLYKGLGSKQRRDLFGEAIKLIFEATQRIEENKEQLYYLLHIISFTV